MCWSLICRRMWAQERFSAELLCASGETDASHELTHDSRFTLLTAWRCCFSLEGCCYANNRCCRVNGDGRHWYAALNLRALGVIHSAPQKCRVQRCAVHRFQKDKVAVWCTFSISVPLSSRLANRPISCWKKKRNHTCPINISDESPKGQMVATATVMLSLSSFTGHIYL